MPTRKAHARWEGSLKEGKGQVDFCAARPGSQGGLPGVASSRRHRDYARGQAGCQLTREALGSAS
jgi:hypothetical protein